MWFITLLLIFYFLYPFLERIYRRSQSAAIFTVIGIAGLFLLHVKVVYGHALWLTAAGYPLGILIARRNIRLSSSIALTLTIASFLAMIGFHYILGFNGMNFFFIITVSLGLCLLLQEINLPQKIIKAGAFLSGILLEIYLLHPYLMIQPTGTAIFNVVFSMTLVVLISAAVGEFPRRMMKIVRYGSNK